MIHHRRVRERVWAFEYRQGTFSGIPLFRTTTTTKQQPVNHTKNEENEFNVALRPQGQYRPLGPGSSEGEKKETMKANTDS